MLVVLTISNVITFSRVDLMTLYRHMGYPEKQLELIEKFNIFTPAQIVMWSVLFMVPIIGYLIFIKKYFRGRYRLSRRRSDHASFGFCHDKPCASATALTGELSVHDIDAADERGLTLASLRPGRDRRAVRCSDR